MSSGKRRIVESAKPAVAGTAKRRTRSLGRVYVNPQKGSKARSHGRPSLGDKLGVMVGFQDEEMMNFL
jgi:hypothetical protein